MYECALSVFFSCQRNGLHHQQLNSVCITELPHCGRPELKFVNGRKNASTLAQMFEFKNCCLFLTVKFTLICFRFVFLNDFASHNIVSRIEFIISQNHDSQNKFQANSHHEPIVREKKHGRLSTIFCPLFAFQSMRAHGTDIHLHTISLSPHKPTAIMNGNQSMSHQKSIMCQKHSYYLGPFGSAAIANAAHCECKTMFFSLIG